MVQGFLKSRGFQDYLEHAHTTGGGVGRGYENESLDAEDAASTANNVESCVFDHSLFPLS